MTGGIAPGERRSIVLAGVLAGVPRQGGASWAVLQYLLGLRRLGHDVLFVEPVTADDGVAGSPAGAYFDDIVAAFGLDGDAALLDAATGAPHGMSRAEVARRCAEADLLLNISGVLADDDLVAPIPIRTFVDLDPAFTQLWAAQGIDLGFDRHNRFVTIGRGIGAPGSPIPDNGRDWISTTPPVVLERWPVGDELVHEALTTVAHWRSYGSIDHDGVRYGQKAHSLRRLIDLPNGVDAEFVLALGIHPGESADLEALRDGGWALIEPDAVAGDPHSYRAFVRGSWAEFGIAKEGYVAAACGWFSDRSACYLASGRPVVAQDTGFSDHLPTGEGLFAFRDDDDVAAAIDELRRDYPRHRRAARAIAEAELDSDIVLRRLLECL